ncbi:MAG: CPBP family intramembrane metalloprotease [Gemmatimonadota bacterium]|nr:CPBP family intramembrane metalloprotease [Gemmatimonadota bacterium]
MRTLAFSSWFYLAFVTLGLPYGAINTARRTRSPDGPAAIPSRAQMHWNGVATHLLLFGISWYAGMLQGLRFLGPAEVTPIDLLAGAAALALLAATAVVSRAVRSEDERSRMWVLGFLPRTWREGVPFAVLAAVAAVSEELTYRGVVFALFAMLTGSGVAGALLSAAVFAAAHFPQGGKSMGLIFAIALIKQGLVVLTHTLWIAIVVHFTYNVLTAFRLRGRARAADGVDPRRRPAESSTWRDGIGG